MRKEGHFDLVFKIVMIGDSNVGKTNLLSCLVGDTFNIDAKATIGVEFQNHFVSIEGKVIKNQIWDTAGQERFRAITHAYYRNTQGIVIVFDLTKSRTFDNVGKWLNQARQHVEPGICIMLLGNKCELQNREVKREVVEDFAKENNLLYYQTSALTGQNVYEASNSLVEEIYQRIKRTPPQPQLPQPFIVRTPQLIQQTTQIKMKPAHKDIKLEPSTNNDPKRKNKDRCCK